MLDSVVRVSGRARLRRRAAGGPRRAAAGGARCTARGHAAQARPRLALHRHRLADLVCRAQAARRRRKAARRASARSCRRAAHSATTARPSSCGRSTRGQPAGSSAASEPTAGLPADEVLFEMADSARRCRAAWGGDGAQPSPNARWPSHLPTLDRPASAFDRELAGARHLGDRARSGDAAGRPPKLPLASALELTPPERGRPAQLATGLGRSTATAAGSIPPRSCCG